MSTTIPHLIWTFGFDCLWVAAVLWWSKKNGYPMDAREFLYVGGGAIAVACVLAFAYGMMGRPL